MPFLMPFEDQFGGTHEATFWLPVIYSYSIPDRMIQFTVNGYLTKEAFAAGKVPLSSRNYRIRTSEFDPIHKDHVLGNRSVLEYLERYVIDKKDVASADGKSASSFFANATVIPFDV